MLGIHNLLLNVLIILVAALAYFGLGLSGQKGRRLIIGVFCGVAVTLCMLFPFTVFPGYFYDLRIIPFLVAILYGGYSSGLLVAVLLLIVRYMIGGGGFEATLFSYIPMFILTLLYLNVSKRYPHSPIIPATAFAFCASVFVSASSMMNHEVLYDYLSFFVYYCVLVTVCMWITVYLIETMRDNIRMRDEILQTEKMQVLGEMAATIAHEIRNPLTVAKGFIQLLGSRSKDETNRRYSGIILDEIERTESVISEYLSYAKPQAEKSETIDVKARLYSIAASMEPFVASHGHGMTFSSEDHIYVRGEPRKFSQAIVNLIKNGVEAMEQSGTIRVSVRKAQDLAIIEISDTGVGMTKEQLQHIGNAFYSTKSKGTGLGLMVTFRILKAMNGDIKVSSEWRKGTTFTIRIPCAVLAGEDS